MLLIELIWMLVYLNMLNIKLPQSESLNIYSIGLVDLSDKTQN